MFADRNDAAARLAEALGAYRGHNPLVLAIPRGAVPIGAVVARNLGGELDLVLVRKLHAPGAPEFAVGAVDETGWVYLAPHAEAVGATASYLAQQKQEQMEELARRRALYTPGRGRIDPAGRVAIVVDDGLARAPPWWRRCTRCGSTAPHGSCARCRWRPPKRCGWWAATPTRWCASMRRGGSPRSASSTRPSRSWRTTR